MNILFITQKLSGGGAERITTLLASELARDNNVYIITHRDDERYEISDNVSIVCLGLNKSINHFMRGRNCIRAIRQIKKIKKEHHIDVTISMLNSPNFENVMSRADDKVIISIRNLTSAQLTGIKAMMSCFSGKHADWIVSLSERVKQDQIDNFKTPIEKSVTIYNPCNYKSIEMQAKQEIEDSFFVELRNRTDCLVMTAGRCTYQKGQWHMIRSFKNVVEKKPEAILVILGKGDMDEALDKLILEMNLEKNVFKLGFKKNIYAYLWNADIFVFSSIFEGFGNILLEAMACELPIISCDCKAGPRELLAPNSNQQSQAKSIEFEEFGILTPPMDGKIYRAEDPLSLEEKALADAINILSSDKELMKEYREKSIKRIEDFSVERIIKQWKEIMK